MITAPEALDRVYENSPISQNLSDQQLLERFNHENDAAAFEALVRRHGPMVLGVCRRVLDNLKDAEDAFQDTFVVLVRKADSLGRPERLASWLHGVAYRISLKSKAQAIQHRRLKKRVTTMAALDSVPPAETGPDLEALDEEFQQLPEKYRIPLVLCYLEGLTNEEAARRIGLPVGSISYQLARGRELLRKRLSRRQGALSVQAFALLLAQKTAPEEIPNELVKSTVAGALRIASSSGGKTSQEVPAALAALAVATALTAESETPTADATATTFTESEMPTAEATAKTCTAVKSNMVAVVLLIVALVGAALVLGPIYGIGLSNEPVLPNAAVKGCKAGSCR